MPGEHGPPLTHASHRHAEHHCWREAAASGSVLSSLPAARAIGGGCTRNQHISKAAAGAMLQTAHRAAAW